MLLLEVSTHKTSLDNELYCFSWMPVTVCGYSVDLIYLLVRFRFINQTHLAIAFKSDCNHLKNTVMTNFVHASIRQNIADKSLHKMFLQFYVIANTFYHGLQVALITTMRAPQM